VSSIFAACIKTEMRQPRKVHALFALDELPATALAKLDTYISTIGGYGGTLLLYLQTVSQLDEVKFAIKCQYPGLSIASLCQGSVCL
jgi:type IV secretory pathway TraG/TraD family ATPase VirD4